MKVILAYSLFMLFSSTSLAESKTDQIIDHVRQIEKSSEKEPEEEEFGGCEPIIVDFRTNDRDGQEVSGSTVMVCNGAYYAIQDSTTVHMVSEKNDQVCYADYSCGNIDSWEGYFSIAGETYFGTLNAFLKGGAIRGTRSYRSYGGNYDDIPDLRIGAIWAFGRAHMQKSCTEISEVVCFSGND